MHEAIITVISETFLPHSEIKYITRVGRKELNVNGFKLLHVSCIIWDEIKVAV